MSDTERKYSQVDKEGLAVIFDVKKFHQYLFCKRCVIYRPQALGGIVCRRQVHPNYGISSQTALGPHFGDV